MSFWDGTQWVTEAGEVAESPPAPSRHPRLKRAAAVVAEGALIAALTVGLIAGSAFAAKGGGGRGGGGGCHGKSCTPTYSATVSVAPDPVAVGTDFAISGCGYPAGGGVQFNLYSSSAVTVWGATANSEGCLNATGWADAVGSARLDVLAGSTTLVARTTFTIE